MDLTVDSSKWSRSKVHQQPPLIVQQRTSDPTLQTTLKKKGPYVRLRETLALKVLSLPGTE